MLIDPLFVRNFLVLMSSCAPFLALALQYVKQLNSERIAIVVQSSLACLFVGVLFGVPYVPGKTFPSVLSLYPLFLFLFNFVLLKKFSSRVFSKILSASLMLSFVLTEFHELPVFIYSFLNLSFMDPGMLFFSLSPLYALAVFWLAARVFNLSLSARSKAALLFSVLGIWIFYWINPLIDINGIPSVLVYVKRAYCFGILVAAFLIGGHPQIE